LLVYSYPHSLVRFTNESELLELIELDLNHYGTGNIRSATLEGESISNSGAKRILNRLCGIKFWFDLEEGQFHVNGDESVVELALKKLQAAI